MSRFPYHGHRFPLAIIQHVVWLNQRFALSLRDVEDMLAERGLDLSYETVRRWVCKFGPLCARDLRRRRPRPTAMAPGRNGDHDRGQAALALAGRGRRRGGARRPGANATGYPGSRQLSACHLSLLCRLWALARFAHA